MKTILIPAIAAAGLALTMSSAFALSNSPQGRVVNGFDDPAFHGGYAPGPDGHFLSGRVYDDGQTYERVPPRTYYRGPVMRRDRYIYEEDGE